MPPTRPPLLERRIVYVTGKGGVGKSTVAAALGLVAAAEGRRTIVCEVAEQGRLSRLLGGGSGEPEHGPPRGERELSPGLWTATIDPREALREWLGTQLGSQRLAGLLNRSNAFAYFVAAAPGAKELVTMTKVWELAQARRWERGAAAYDTVIVDAPASGHGVAMLRTPRAFADIARVGPIAKQAGRVRDALADRSFTGYVAVATAAEMPVSETIELEARLERDVGVTLETVVVNGLYQQRFSGPQSEAFVDASSNGAGPLGAAALRAAVSQARRVRGQQSQLRRLRREGRAPVLTLPFVFSPQLGLDAVSSLADELGRKLATA